MMIADVILVVLLVGGCFYGHFSEAKSFNKGVCRKCGNELEYFDKDSQGGRGYFCRKCGYYTWVSWFADRKFQQKGGKE